MDCRILGPVEIGHDRRVLALGSTKEALLLAALAYDVGRPVGLDTLVRRVWDGDPPGNPLNSLYANATRLRRHMEEVLAGDGTVPTIKRRSHTYTLEAAPEAVDWHRFQRLVGEARALSEDEDDPDLHQALDLFQQAEALWRGEALAGLGGLWAEGLRTTLRGKRVEAAVARIALELRLGHFADVMGELTELVARRPTDEILVGQLMIARHGRGLHADALRLYADLRRRLREELGSQPGPELAGIHELILSHAPVSALLPRGRRPVDRTPAPQVLPQHAQLVGREDEMGTLMDRIDRSASGSASTVTVAAISGMAGVGKSLMAWTAAERLAGRFPDGQISLDLRTHGTAQEPVTPQSALTQLLRTLGTLQRPLPGSLEELTALWYGTLRQRRVVVVLDDASSPEQIRPLLPPSSPSLFLITSRRRLSGLPGAFPIVLDVLPQHDAAVLFRRMIEDDRADHPEEVEKIVSLCGQLPLAVEIAASRLNSRPSWSLQYLIERLSREHARIEELHDTDREIAGVFRLSYATLGIEDRTVFRMLRLHLAPEFGPHSAGALIGLPLFRVERAMDALVDAHLLQAPAAERYRYHDLLGDFAEGLGSAEDSAADRSAALRRLVDFYIVAVDAADRLIRPERSRLDLIDTGTDTGGLPSWRDAADAENWLMTEHLELINVARYARHHGMFRQAAVLGHVMAGFLGAGGFWAEAERIHRHAVHYWHETGEQAAEVRARIDLGTVYSSSGHYERAMAALSSAAAIAADAGDVDAELEALHQLATVHWHQGRLDAARAVQRDVLAVREKQGDRRQVARCLNNLGITSLYLGQYGMARIALSEALREFRAIGDGVDQRRTLNNLADLNVRVGEKEAARQILKEARNISPLNVNKSDLAVIDITLAGALPIPGQSDEALRLLRDALESFRELGDLRNQVICLNETGRVHRESGHADDAVRLHVSALDLARSIGAMMEEAQSLLLLGTAERVLGQYRSAIGHLDSARVLAQSIHLLPEESEAAAELVRARAGMATGLGEQRPDARHTPPTRRMRLGGEGEPGAVG
ncbi:tetratricopeptide repeat protein [Streptomyces sp. NBC_01622]|uniref:AfsR/SARP family transcriptional regulator n=1 Tax=Streptomyces sp. NBC_01622 TaxID=2975903 RepID=UPI0038682932|nr:tetratricopeptide repeat protein [Streptomyces sp. NBC_01622]